MLLDAKVSVVKGKTWTPL